MLFYWHFKWNRQEKYVKIDIPLCWSCWKNKPKGFFHLSIDTDISNRGVKS